MIDPYSQRALRDGYCVYGRAPVFSGGLLFVRSTDRFQRISDMAYVPAEEAIEPELHAVLRVYTPVAFHRRHRR